MKNTYKRIYRPLYTWFIGPIIGISLITGLAVLPTTSPETSAAIADTLRSVVGPQAVSLLESAVFQLQDLWNRAQYQTTGQPQEINWDSPALANVTPSPSPGQASQAAKQTNHPSTAMPFQKRVGPPKAEPTQMAKGATYPTDAIANMVTSTNSEETSVIDALPTLTGGWQAFGSTGSAGLPVMARGVVQPDPTRAFARAAVVRMDLHQVKLHLVAGTKEPTFAKSLPTFDRPGFIPYADTAPGTLLAAFNGGFKAEHGHYGMMVDGKLILPPIEGMATIGIYQTGRIQIGAWGQGISQTQDLIAFRQNCPLLVQRGQIQPNIDSTDLLTWGFTGKGSPTATWRSGLGLSQDGRFLIYVVGKSLTAQTLGTALQQAGAYYGMQLDINGYYTRFATYQPSDAAVNAFPTQAVMLLKDMRGDAQQFLVPYKRDFFYVTTVGK